MTGQPATRGYSTREVARLLGLTENEIRSWVHAGFLEPARGPRGSFRFFFQDLVVLRTAKGLVDNEIPNRRVRRVLRRLSDELPRGRSLAALKITVDGEEIVVHDDALLWNPESGQQVLNFEVSELAAKAAPLAQSALRQAVERNDLVAEDWFELAVELEAASIGEASEAYRRCLDLAPDFADAHVNLGRLLHEQGNIDAAERHYRAALALEPRDPTAAFNLGVALQDLDHIEDAIRAYQHAIALDSGYADAYFNLAELLEKAGQQALAIQHFKNYKRLKHDND